jgi:hypothetical protein
MKKRVRVAPSNPFYSNEPAVARSNITSKAPVPSAGLANRPPKMVDKSPGRLSGVAGFADKKKPHGQSAKVPVKSSGVPGPAKFPKMGKPKKI